MFLKECVVFTLSHLCFIELISCSSSRVFWRKRICKMDRCFLFCIYWWRFSWFFCRMEWLLSSISLLYVYTPILRYLYAFRFHRQSCGNGVQTCVVFFFEVAVSSGHQCLVTFCRSVYTGAIRISRTPAVLSYLATHFTTYVTNLECPKGSVWVSPLSWQTNSAPCPVGYFQGNLSSLFVEVYAP